MTAETFLADAPLVTTTAGTVRGFWRSFKATAGTDGPAPSESAAFLGIPFAKAPVGPLRFTAPVPPDPWNGVRDAVAMGPTPQRRPLMEITTIPEPSIPGEATLNVNVFTPRPGDRNAHLPVFVWIHGGGYTAGSPASPWYDGRAFNADGIVTVTLSYRLGFDGYGWMEDAPTNRGVRDQIAALEWVRDNIEAFGGDPSKVTIGGQSAGGGSVLWLLACPAAQPLFRAVISHSGSAPVITAAAAEDNGRAFAESMGVKPTREGWSALTELNVFEHQGEPMTGETNPLSQLRAMVTGEGSGGMLTWAPHLDDDLLPYSPAEAAARGIGADKALLIGTVANEFSMMFMGPPPGTPTGDATPASPFGGASTDQVLAAAGLSPQAVEVVDRAFAAMPDQLRVGQVITEFLFRIPALTAAERSGPTWLFDFRWPSPVMGLSFHCIDLPFAWGLLDAVGVPEALGPNPPKDLESVMHQAWVQFVRDGDPGWQRCAPTADGARPGMVFDVTSSQSAAPYGTEAELVKAQG